MSGAVAAPVEELEAAPPTAAQVSMGEMCWKQRGVRRWLWTASTARFAVSAIPRRRSSVQVRARLRRAHLDRDRHGAVAGFRGGLPVPRQAAAGRRGSPTLLAA